MVERDHAHRVGLETLVQKSGGGRTRFCVPCTPAPSARFRPEILPTHVCLRRTRRLYSSGEGKKSSPPTSACVSQNVLRRGSRGPKLSAWTKPGARRFESFFARNSDPDIRAEQPPAEADSAERLHRLFTGVVGETLSCSAHESAATQHRIRRDWCARRQTLPLARRDTPEGARARAAKRGARAKQQGHQLD